MTKLGSGTMRAAKRVGAGATIGALFAGIGFVALPATADETAGDVQMSDVSLAWTMSDEAGGGAYFGGCNFFSAGISGDAGSSHVWTADEAASLYKSEDGNVTITRPDAQGNQVQPTWDTKCLGADGKAVTPWAGSTTHQQVNFANGAGAINPATDTGTINWAGGYTIVFYGGMTYWSARDLQLDVVNGKGELSATVSGYGAAMNDNKKWIKLEDERVELATFSGVDLTNDGAVVVTDWSGVEANFTPEETKAGASAQNRTADGWGAFPQSFTKFQVKTGQSSYWYSSGGNSDPKKPSKPFTLGYHIDQPADANDGGDIDVTIPAVTPTPEPETGAFSWQWASKDPVNLGTAVQDGASFVASGALNNVLVSDTRKNTPTARSWSLSGQASDFTATSGDSFSGSFLGWSPKVVSTDAPLVGGAVVASTQLGGEGLANSAVLAAGAARSATLGADLKLVVPSTTKSGDYKSTLTITAIS